MKKVCIGLMMFAFLFSASLGASQAQAKEVVLGCNFLLSGPAANIGIGMQRAVERVADIVNKEGFTAGGEKYVLKPVFYDSKYVPAESVSNIEKMIALEAQGNVKVSVDLAAQTVSAEAGGVKQTFPFEISPFDKALVEAGGWVEYADARY